MKQQEGNPTNSIGLSCPPSLRKVKSLLRVLFGECQILPSRAALGDLARPASRLCKRRATAGCSPSGRRDARGFEPGELALRAAGLSPGWSPRRSRSASRAAVTRSQAPSLTSLSPSSFYHPPRPASRRSPLRPTRRAHWPRRTGSLSINARSRGRRARGGTAGSARARSIPVALLGTSTPRLQTCSLPFLLPAATKPGRALRPLRSPPRGRCTLRRRGASSPKPLLLSVPAPSLGHTC